MPIATARPALVGKTPFGLLQLIKAVSSVPTFSSPPVPAIQPARGRIPRPAIINAMLFMVCVLLLISAVFQRLRREQLQPPCRKSPVRANSDDPLLSRDIWHLRTNYGER